MKVKLEMVIELGEMDVGDLATANATEFSGRGLETKHGVKAAARAPLE